MKRVAILLGVTMGVACMESEGVNLSTVDGQTFRDVVRAKDASRELREEVLPEPGPPFGDTLGWKVLEPGVTRVWNDVIGVEQPGGGHRVFFGGALGAVVSYDTAKRKWYNLELPETKEVRGVWAAAPDYVLACGEQGLLKRHFDYASTGVEEWYNDDLSLGLSTDFEAADGLAKDIIWVVGRDGTALQFDGDAWKVWSKAEIGFSDAAASLYDVKVISSDEVLMVGDGVLVKFKAGVFTVDTTSFAGYKTRGIYARGGQVWVGADKGTVFVDEGDGVWEEHHPNVYSVFESLWIAPSGKVYAAGAHPPPTVWVYDGNEADSWTPLSVEPPIFIKQEFPNRIVANSRISGIWGSGEQDLFVCTKEKQIIHYAVHK